MTYLLKNPSGIIVEVDELDQFKRLLRKPGFDLILDNTEEAKQFRFKKQVQSPENKKNHTQIQFIAPPAHSDGYGQSRGFIEEALLLFGINLDKNFTGQKIGIAYGYPEMVDMLKTPIKVIFTMFESTKIPQEWYKHLEKSDLIIVPSRFCQEVFKNAGFESVVVPLGYDDKTFVYKQKDYEKEPFVFLHYDAFNQRKGWDLVFKAFNEEFRSESARLILKTTKLAGYPFPIMKSQYPQIDVIKEQSKSEELADLLQNADCFVLPSRGEGFGIPPLEAIATGTPTIIPNAHGFSEYFSKEHFFEVRIKESTPALYERYKGVDTGTMSEPDVEDLKRQMRFVYEHRSYAFEMAEKSSQWVKENWTYKQTAQRLASILSDLNRQKAIVEVQKAEKGIFKHSIIVLTFNALKYTKKCLESILKNTPDNYELIFVDNASTDGTIEWLKEVEKEKKGFPIKFIYNKENKGVAGGRNQACEIATGEFISFIDNDTEVQKGWQDQILTNFDDKRVGIVGKNGQIVNFLKPVKFSEPTKTEGKAFVDVVPGFCFTFRRDLLGIIGENFEDFPNGKFWHEDLDFCIRATIAGFKIMSDDNIKIVHHEHKSMGENVDNTQSVNKVMGFYENAAFIQERMISDNIVLLHRDWGGFDNPNSYDRVCTTLSKELRKLGMVAIRKPSVTTGCASFTLCKGFDILHNGKRYIWLHQENDRCPEEWRKDMQHVDYAFCASPHLIEACKDEPYFEKLINVTPDGIDSSIYNMQVKKLDNFYDDKFKFLFVGATQPRKNSENLVKWYVDTFTKKDRVILIIKSFGYGQHAEMMKLLSEVQKDKNAPEIAYIYEDWTSEYLARVYRTVAENGVYISPHHAECFGLPQIEAVACGCKIGTTGWGGASHNLKGLKTVTLFDYKMGDSTFHNHKGEPFYKKGENPQWAEPDEKQVVKFMIDSVKSVYDFEEAEKASKLILKKFSYQARAKEIKEALCKK